MGGDGEKHKSKGGLRSIFKRKTKKVDETEGQQQVKEAAEKTAGEATAIPKSKSTATAATAASSTEQQPPKSKAQTATTAKTVGLSRELENEKPSWLMRTKYFQRLSNWAFDVVDTDGSGSVDEKELYSGLLLIHLKLGSMAGPAACKPVQRERVNEIFLKRDLDHSGSLDREEFMVVMSVLCGNIVTRVIAQWSLTLMIVPMVAQYLLDAISWIVTTVWDALNELDNYESLESVAAEQFGHVSNALARAMPRPVLFVATKTGDFITYVIDVVPDSVWTSVPVTLVSCVLSCIAVPFIILTIDDYFQSLADSKKKTERVEI